MLWFSVQSSSEDIRLSTVEMQEDVVVFLPSFAASWGLCKLLQGRWNNWLAYLFILSVCWQPARPGDLAYRQQVKQTGNYCVTFSPGCGSIADPGLHFFLVSVVRMCLICYFILSIRPCFLEFAESALSKAICLPILKVEFVYDKENKMWGNETDA